MFIGVKLLLQFVLLQSLVVGALCCRCRHQHPQKSYCSQEFVMKIRVGYQDENRILVAIDQVIKGEVQDLNVTLGLVELTMPPLCGMDLSLGDTLIFFGNKDQNGRLHTEICFGDKRQRSFLISRLYTLIENYNYGCDCKSELDDMNKDDCYWRFSFIQAYNGPCTLSKMDEFENCINKKPSPTTPMPANFNRRRSYYHYFLNRA